MSGLPARLLLEISVDSLSHHSRHLFSPLFPERHRISLGCAKILTCGLHGAE